MTGKTDLRGATSTRVRALRPAAMSLLALMTLGPGRAQAQDVACEELAQTTAEMLSCLGLAFEAADGALNAAYADALAQAKRRGAEQEALLREAQRAWVTFRDAACTAEGSLYEGGSVRPVVETDCWTRLTQVRTEDLLIYVEAGAP